MSTWWQIENIKIHFEYLTIIVCAVCSFAATQLFVNYMSSTHVINELSCSTFIILFSWKCGFEIHTMPGGTSTSSALPVKRTTTSHSNSHSRMQNCWSLKLSIAKFCTIANIWGEICKHIKSKFLTSKLL